MTALPNLRRFDGALLSPAAQTEWDWQVLDDLDRMGDEYDDVYERLLATVERERQWTQQAAQQVSLVCGTVLLIQVPWRWPADKLAVYYRIGDMPVRMFRTLTAGVRASIWSDGRRRTVPFHTVSEDAIEITRDEWRVLDERYRQNISAA